MRLVVLVPLLLAGCTASPTPDAEATPGRAAQEACAALGFSSAWADGTLRYEATVRNCGASPMSLGGGCDSRDLGVYLVRPDGSRWRLSEGSAVDPADDACPAGAPAVAPLVLAPGEAHVMRGSWNGSLAVHPEGRDVGTPVRHAPAEPGDDRVEVRARRVDARQAWTLAVDLNGAGA